MSDEQDKAKRFRLRFLFTVTFGFCLLLSIPRWLPEVTFWVAITIGFCLWIGFSHDPSLRGAVRGVTVGVLIGGALAGTFVFADMLWFWLQSTR